jgi:HAMP domain-containing protein
VTAQSAQAPRPSLLARLRVPLHFKVMVSYLVVVGLVLFPTLIYLRTLFRQSLIEVTEKRMDAEAAVLAGRLGAASPEELPQIAAVIVGAMPQRVTVVDLGGNVVADSLGDHALGSHAKRPEIVAALATGFGTAVRSSTTTQNERIYVARPFPMVGPPRGVVRLSVPTHDLDDALGRSYRFTEKAGALGLSAAVVLSLVAALVVSRPLRRLTEALRAYGQGDFGHPVAVDSGDELGEVADALRDLARTLSARLREAGSHKAALEILLEELPIGAIVYDAERRPLTVTAQARALCSMALTGEHERAAELVRLPECAAAIAEAEHEQRAVECTVTLPARGKRGPSLRARWVIVPGSPDGGRIIGLLSDEADAHRITALEALVRADGSLLRQAAGAAPEVKLAAKLEAAADEAERAVLSRRALPEQVETREVGALCEAVLDDVRARAAARGIRIHVELDDPKLRVVEAQGRSLQAVRRLLDAMITEAQPNAEVRVESEAGAKLVRITARTSEARRIKTKPIGEIIHCLGGDAGSKHTGDASEAWVKLPRG